MFKKPQAKLTQLAMKYKRQLKEIDAGETPPEHRWGHASQKWYKMKSKFHAPKEVLKAKLLKLKEYQIRMSELEDGGDELLDFSAVGVSVFVTPSQVDMSQFNYTSTFFGKSACEKLGKEIDGVKNEKPLTLDHHWDTMSIT